uniref:Uncharacterized protein n=1 Tax=viral metagenome TaxID=1070528 RepID=A0A6M3LBY3_9ZZZZ
MFEQEKISIKTKPVDAWSQEEINHFLTFLKRDVAQNLSHHIIAFLLEPEQLKQWGWVECPECKGVGGGILSIPQGDGAILEKWKCKCKDGKAKHPAFEFALSLGDK